MHLTTEEQKKFEDFKLIKALMQGLPDDELRDEAVEDVLLRRDGLFGTLASDRFLRMMKREFEKRGMNDFDKIVQEKKTKCMVSK
jgi:hypothetical protein